MRRTVARTVKRVFCNSGAAAAVRRIFPSRQPIIVRYHSISQGNNLISDGIVVSPEIFEQQVSFFAKHFVPASMDTLIDCIERQLPFPENAVVLTFDDGYADNYAAALTLKKYGMTGVFYITAGCIDSGETFWVAEIHHLLGKTRRQHLSLRIREHWFHANLSEAPRTHSIRELTHLIKEVDIDSRERARDELRKQLDDVPPIDYKLMLTWEQLKEMAAIGMEIGGHTMTHCNLPSATADEAWSEVHNCKTLLEQKLATNVRHFAYPNGGSTQYYNPAVTRLVKQAGYRSAVTSKLGTVGLTDDPFELRRIRTTERLSDVVWEIEESRLRFATR